MYERYAPFGFAFPAYAMYYMSIPGQKPLSNAKEILQFAHFLLKL